MATIQLLISFAETARRGSFAAAARELGLTPSAVAKNVQRLEARLKLKLFHRTTRRVAMTPEGESLFERCQRILDALGELELAAADAGREPSGTLKVDAPLVWGRLVLMPLLAKLAARHPALCLDVRLSDRHADVVGEGLDAVVRIGPLAESRLVARPIGQQRLAVYASSDYLARHGLPRRPEDLVRHRWLAFRFQHSGRVRPLELVRGGRTLALDLKAAHTFNDGEGLITAAALGLGIAQTPDYMIAAAPPGHGLVEILKGFRPPPLPISLVFPGARRVPPRLRALIEAFTTEETRGGQGQRGYAE